MWVAVAGILVTAVGFFGVVLTLITIFLKVREDKRVEMSPGAMAWLISSVAVVCIGIAVLVYTVTASEPTDGKVELDNGVPPSPIVSDSEKESPSPEPAPTPEPSHPPETPTPAPPAAPTPEPSEPQIPTNAPFPTYTPTPPPEPSVTRAPQAETLVLDVYCENVPSFEDYYISAIGHKNEGTLHFDGGDFPVTFNCTAGYYTIKIYQQSTGDWLCTYDPVYLGAGDETLSLPFNYYAQEPEPAPSELQSKLADIPWGYDSFDSANVWIALMDGDEHAAYGAEVCIGYAGSDTLHKIADYDGRAIYAKVEIGVEYDVCAIIDETIVADQSFSIPDSNTFHICQIYLP